MAVDLRHWAWCSLGPLAPIEAAVTLADDHIQGRGVCMTKGTVILQGIHRPNMGDPVSLAYGNGSYLDRVPRRLRVLSSFADPLERTTTVSVGCLLALFENRRPPVENPTAVEENTDVPDVVRRVAATSMSAAWVIGRILTGLGITAASAVPFNFHRVVDEWDLSAGYVEELGRICDSARHFCRINEAEQLEFISKDESDNGPAPLLTEAEILSLQPVNVGELPGDAVYARYQSAKLRLPIYDTSIGPGGQEEQQPLPPDEMARRNWEYESVSAGPVEVTHSYVNASGVLVEERVTYNDFSISETSYDTQDRVTSRTETSNTVNGIRQSITTFTYDATTYGANSAVLEEVTMEYTPAGDIAAQCGKNGPISEFRTGTMLSGVRVTTYDKDSSTGSTQTITKTLVPYINTPFGSNAVAVMREEGKPYLELFTIASQLVPLNPVIRIRSERNFGLQQRPSQQERNRLASAKVPTVEEITSSTWAVGSPTSETAVELSPPYVSDDRIVASGNPVVYTVVRADAEQQALAYARTENYLRLGNRNGAGLQLSPLDCPARPFSPFVVRLNGCTARYRTNGTTWTIGTGGVAVTTDALFRGAVDGTLANAWFPLPPGVTSLPAAGSVTTNANPRPANYMAVPSGFNPQNPDLVALFAALPTAVAAIPRATLSPASPMIRPWRETVRLRGGVRVGGRIRELPPGPQGETLRGGVRVGGRVYDAALIVQPARGAGRGMPLTLTSEDPVSLRLTSARGAGQGMPLTLTSSGGSPVVAVTNRSSLTGSGNQFIDWGSLGSAGVSLSHPRNITTNEGTTMSLTMVYTNSFRRRDQVVVGSATPWQGNFTLGDKLLFTNAFDNAQNPISLRWTTTGFAAVGTQIQIAYQGTFTARVIAYGAGDTVLGSVDVTGTSDSNYGTAVFLGIRSTSSGSPIYGVDFLALSSPFPAIAAFAINQVDLNTTFT
jgi:hypothetical protein